MPTPQETVAAAIRFFFENALPGATGKRWADLHAPKCHLGAYATYSGAAVPTVFGQSVTPKYVLKVSKRELPVSGGGPNPQGASVGSDLESRHILWVRHAADAKVDSAEEIARVMADLDSFSNLFDAAGTGAPSGTPPPAPTPVVAGSSATAWGAAIVASRQALPTNLEQLTTVPSGLAALCDKAEQLKAVLRHFFTYDEAGVYYPRWANPSGAHDPNMPGQLYATYKEKNVREVRLERDTVYLYAVVPQSLLGGQGDPSIFREVVIRFDDTDDATTPFTLATIHTAQWRRAVAPHEDFVFLHTDVGEGLPAAPAVRGKLNPPLTQFLAELIGAGDQREAVLSDGPNITRGPAGAYVNVVAAVEGNVTWPDGVLQFDDKPVRRLAIPVDKVLDVAQLPAVKRLSVIYQPAVQLDLVRNAVHFNDLLTRLPAGARNGQGVLVGVIDSGIDGSHPAFAGRLVAFWDQGTPPLVAGPTPAAAHPPGTANSAAYAAFAYGVELQSAPLAPASANPPSTAQDNNVVGHGTHVSGIAAGAGVPNPATPGAFLVPPGFASQARIAVVRAIQVGNNGNYLDGISWIFQKATELGVPCVINMSIGEHFHPHDGTDDLDFAVFQTVADAAGNYAPGRILVAAASNDRKRHIHMRRSLPARGNADFPLQIPANSFLQRVHLWIKNPNPASNPNAAFPLDVVVSGSNLRRNTPVSVTRSVRIGTDAVGPGPGAAGNFPAHRTRIEIVTRRAGNLRNHDYLIEVRFRTTDPPPVNPAAAVRLPMLQEVWTIRLLNRTGHVLDVHAWTQDGATLPHSNQPDDEAFLVARPAVCPGTVSVAASVTRNQWIGISGAPSAAGANEPNPPELASFSSPGPLRFASVQPERVYPVHHEINAIDVTAPGAHTLSALTSQLPAASLAAFTNLGLVVNARGMMQAGTSMATPVITGLIANILAETPNLTLPQVLDRLRAASHIPPGSNFQPRLPVESPAERRLRTLATPGTGVTASSTHRSSGREDGKARLGAAAGPRRRDGTVSHPRVLYASRHAEGHRASRPDRPRRDGERPRDGRSYRGAGGSGRRLERRTHSPALAELTCCCFPRRLGAFMEPGPCPPLGRGLPRRSASFLCDRRLQHGQDAATRDLPCERHASGAHASCSASNPERQRIASRRRLDITPLSVFGSHNRVIESSWSATPSSSPVIRRSRMFFISDRRGP